MDAVNLILGTICILCIAVSANKAERSARESMEEPGKKFDHGCPGCGAPAISTQQCSYCGREN